MGKAISGLFGGAPKDNTAELMRSQQRRTLAELAAQQAEIDQAGSTGGRRQGSQMLTFLQAGEKLGGSSKFGNI